LAVNNGDTTGEFLEVLSKAKRVLLTTHARPDGDALGSVAALALALRAAGKHTEQLLLTHLPSKYRFVFADAGLDHHDAERGTGIPALTGFDTVIVADTGTWSQLPGMELRLSQFGGRVAVIDHHKTQEPWGNVRVVDTSVSSAAELVCRVLRRGGYAITREIAQAVYVGIVSDTGHLQFSNTTPTALRMVADLMETGIDTDRVYQLLTQSERAPRLRLQARAHASLELHADNRLAVMTVLASDFAEVGADVPDTENIVNFPLAIATVEMALLVTEPPAVEGKPQPIRVSCRSKGRIDVARFAEPFGGGGHARASGLKLPQPLGEAKAAVVRAAIGAVVS
jgi:bifunctional oligoribonuclease and PAP phosphatase NrnA